MPQRRQNSIVRTPMRSIFGCSTTPAVFSIRVHGTPRQPRSPASASPTGPAPTIKTGVRSVSLSSQERAAVIIGRGYKVSFAGRRGSLMPKPVAGAWPLLHGRVEITNNGSSRTRTQHDRRRSFRVHVLAPLHSLAHGTRPVAGRHHYPRRLAARQRNRRQLLAQFAVGDAVALCRATDERRADIPRQLHVGRGCRRHGDRRCPRRVAAIPAAPAPDCRRHSRSVHDRRLWRAKTCLRALVHSVVRHRHRIQDCACRESRFLHRLFRHAQRRARSRCQARADGADHRRQRAPGLASHRSPGRRAFDLRWFSHRGPLLSRRRRNRRADLVQPRAWLSGADRSDEFRHHQRVRGHRNGDAPGARRQLAHEFARDAAAVLAAADRSDHGNVTMAGAALLEVRKLGKRFAQRHGREASPWVIQDLSFSVREGEFLTIVGPSGAGKSTLLNIIAQIDTTTAGEIVFDGTNVTTRDPRALRPGCNRRIGYVTQEDNLLPWRSTLHNVLFSVEVQGRLNDETRGRAEMLIHAVGLAGYERYYPNELSGGMRKRTALIRTLVYDPPVILMDEPFASVDAQT